MTCELCVSGNSQSIYVGVGVVCSLVVAIVIFCYCRYKGGDIADKSMAASRDFNRASEFSTRLKNKVGAAWNVFLKIRVPFKILMSYAQIVSGFSFNYQLRFPVNFNAAMRWFSLANIDFLTLAPMGCVVSVNYHVTLLGYTIAPLVVCAVFVALYRFLATRTYENEAKNNSKNKVFNMFLVFTYLILPTTSTKVLNTFNCDHLDGGDQVLKSDLSIDCKTTTHKVFEVYAIVMSVVFPFGIPLMYAVMLYKSRHFLDPGQDKMVNTTIVQLVIETADEDTGEGKETKTVQILGYLVEEVAVERAIATAINSGQVINPLSFNGGFREKHLLLHEHVQGTKNVIRQFWHKKTEPGGIEQQILGIEVILDEEGALKEAIRRREELEKGHPELARMKFLFEAYEPRCWWFEVFETLRRLILTGGQIFLKPGTASQIILNILICMVSMRIYAKFEPFIDFNHDRLAEAAQW